MTETFIMPGTKIEDACKQAIRTGRPTFFKFNGVVVETAEGRTWGMMANYFYSELDKNSRKFNASRTERADRIEEDLRMILDAADYLAGNCKVNDPVGGVLPRILIERARHHLNKQP